MEKEKTLYCDSCESEYMIAYRAADGNPDTCPFCGSIVSEFQDDQEEEDEEET
jgi:rubrerythrin